MRIPVLLSLLLSTALVHAAEQSRTLPAFDAVSSKGAAHIVIEVGKTQSVVLSGDDAFLAKVQTKVVGSELQLSFGDEKNQKINRDAKIVINLPALRAYKLEGAGSTTLNNVSGERLAINLEGAGRLVANGKVKSLVLKAQGVGDVDTKALLAQKADVQFEGIGSVKIYASEELNAKVEGMGSVSYFGKPRTVKKSVEGIGSVRAGD